MSVRVLLVDDHSMMLEGLSALFVGAPDVEVVGAACDGNGAIDLVRTLAPDVVVMDVEMPGMSGVEATQRIVTEHERVRVVALSAYKDERSVRRMLDAGACGYVPKTCAYDELLRAVRAAKVGRTYLSPEIAGSIVARSIRVQVDGEGPGCASLGAREREVLILVAQGKTSTEAAKAMQISVKTVKMHRKNIAKKLQLHSTADLTKYAIREGLISL